MSDANLSTAAQRRLTFLEGQISQSFFLMGKAFEEIRERGLYRRDYSTFDEYLRARWNMSYHRAQQLVRAAHTVEDLRASVTVGHTPMPSSERQVRPLLRLRSPQQKAAAWTEAVRIGGPSPASHVVESVVDTAVEEFDALLDEQSEQRLVEFNETVAERARKKGIARSESGRLARRLDRGQLRIHQAIKVYANADIPDEWVKWRDEIVASLTEALNVAEREDRTEE